jgi:Tol biopolymer transport system component
LRLLKKTCVGSAAAFLAIVLACPFASHAEQSQAISIDVFAPSVISSAAHDSAPAFTPSGTTVYFGRSNAEQSVILVSQRKADGQWGIPQIAPFSGEWNDMEPAMAPDGSFLVFVSDRPDGEARKPVEGFFNGKPQNGGRLWRVERNQEKWGEPVLLPAAVNTNTSIFAPSVANDGSLYFMTTDAVTGRFRLYRSQFEGDRYGPAIALPFSDGSVSDVDPAVAPDESFLIFGSGRNKARGMDLFIVFREGDGWSRPVYLGDDVSTPLSDAEPRLSADGSDLYFSSERTVPVAFPRTAKQANTEIARMETWDNGLYNIWRAPLHELVARARRELGESAASRK